MQYGDKLFDILFIKLKMSKNVIKISIVIEKFKYFFLIIIIMENTNRYFIL